MDVIDLTNESDDEDLKFDVNLFSHRSTNPDIQHAGRPNFTTKTHNNIGMNTPPSYPSASRSPVASKSKGKVKETDSRLFAADGPRAGPSNESNHGDRVSKDISGKTNSRKRQAGPHETKSLPKAPKVRKIVSPSTTKGGKSINWSETIIISSDDGSGDDEVVCTRIEFNKASRSAGRSQTKNPRSHRPRPTDSPAGPSSQTAAIFTYPQSSALEEESYDEADWENYHAGFALPLYKDDSNEVPTALPDSEIDALSQRLRHQHVGRHRQPSERGRPDIKVLYPVKTNQKHHPGWPHGRHPSYYSDQVKVHTLYGPGMGGEDDYTAGGLELVTSIRQASGPISRISQNGPSAVVASAALGGLPSPSLTDVRTCNTPGALLCWNQKQRNEIQTMDAHYREDESIRYVDGMHLGRVFSTLLIKLRHLTYRDWQCCK
ncbi:hypothetical protein FRC02_007415 [Tulasnella sp. 418]|nr:hypothetical protein FRC02_007415 [Tulasnella sp. 418]